VSAATVTALPGTRLATIPDLDPSRRMVLLAGLACEVIDRQRDGRKPLPDTFVTLLLRGLCPDGMTPEAQAEGFAEYVDAVLLEQDCETGWVHWTQIEPGLTCEGAAGDRAGDRAGMGSGRTSGARSRNLRQRGELKWRATQTGERRT
jgi:hypothetical protein